jgi:hypothetical protein
MGTAKQWKPYRELFHCYRQRKGRVRSLSLTSVALHVVGHQKALFSEFWPGGKDASDIIRAEGAIPRQSSASKHFN